MADLRTDVVVVGAGIVGLGLAWSLAVYGRADVVVLERDLAGHGSTGRSSGGIRAQFATDYEVELSLRAWSFFERILADGDFAGTFDRTGYAFLADERSQPELRRAFALQKRHGVPSEWLEGADLLDAFPYCDLRPIVAATLCTEDGFVDPWELHQWLLRRTRDLGIRVLERHPAESLEVAAAGCTAAGSWGSVEGSMLVDAAGAWAAEVAARAGLEVAVRPSPRLKWVTDPHPALPADMPLVTDLPTGAYVRSERGAAMVGVKPAAPVFGYDVDAGTDVIAEMAARAVVRFPSLAGAAVARLVTGLYEVTPDGLPVAGPLDAARRVWVVAGFNGHGIMHSLPVTRATAEAMATGRSADLDLAPLSPARFDGGQPQAPAAQLL